MRRTITLGLAAFGLMLGLSLPAMADPAQIFGKWIEEGPNGTEMVTEFTATAVSSYGLDQSGKRVGDTNRFAVTYKDVGPSTIQVNFQTGGGGILLHIQDKDTIVMEFPGAGTHTMTRDIP
jgi:hypothetical protein